MKTAFLFPGQGSQEVGMGADLFREDPEFRVLVQQASDCAGADLECLCLRGPERELARTEWLQPLLVAVSLGYLKRLTQGGIRADLVLGHSLGEVSALVAAGALDAKRALELAAHRGRCMASAACHAEGGMMAVTGVEASNVLKVLDPLLQASHLFLANDNAPSQVVFSGTKDALEEARSRIAQAKAGTTRTLAVAGPWHSPLMREAQAEFAAYLLNVPLGSPRVPLIMNHSAVPEIEPERIRECLVRNLTGTARWRSSMDCLRKAQARTLLEVGPGRVLSGLARANGLGDDIQIVNVNNLRGAERAVSLLTAPGAPARQQPSPLE